VLPLGYDNRMVYRKHQVGETITDGIAEPNWETDGPYLVAFRPGKQMRQNTEEGYSETATVYYCIAPDTEVFSSGDILTDGTNDLYEIRELKDFPTEQQFYVRAVQ